MSHRVYNVKQAAKILGLSTNTTYKYLNEGRIKAARGHVRGTFIIPHKSLEIFLGTPLPESESISTDNQQSQVFDPEAIIEVTPPTFTAKITRVILLLTLLMFIVDIIITPTTSIGQLIRILTLIAIALLSYQFGGFTTK